MVISDPRYGAQWHFSLLGDIETIWADYSGAGVAVGVYDDGMDQSHEDLVSNYDAALHFSTGAVQDDGQHDTIIDGHGTAVAGVIAAGLNGLGGVGVAWGAQLSAVDYLGTLQYEDFATTQLAALRHMAAFDVVNMSYGTLPDYNRGAPGGSDIGDGPDGFTGGGAGGLSWGYLEADAMAVAAMSGRGGLGTLLVKAAGNDANAPSLAAQGLYGNAQGEGQNNLHTVVAVAATDPNGAVTSYSNYGYNLLIAAPAASETTDVTGVGGYDYGRYISNFGGTSAAAPVVSGVLALMLEAAPELGARDVQNILAASAAQTGSAFGAAGQGWEVGAWQSFGQGTWNGGALSYHQSYGYGLLDAYAAVRMAEVWPLMQPEARSFDNQTEIALEASPSAQISSLSGAATASFTYAGASLVLDHAYVEVDLEHERSGDLTIELITPGGDALRLFDGEGGETVVSDDWTFGLAALRGMDAAGTWEVRVTDDGAGHDGILWDARLRLLGQMEDPLVDDIWTVTADFQELAAQDTTRARFDDSNGGTDWLNLVALRPDVTVALGAPGEDGSLRVGGAEWLSLADGGLENVASGDGDDLLTGSQAANVMLAGRGRNILTGQGGADALTGVGTMDVLQGEARGLYGTAASAQVWRLFDTVFDRAPASAGHQQFTAQLLAGTESLASLARGFMAGPEFLNRYGATSDTAFVTLLYNNVLERAPDGTGLQAWVTALENGMSREDVVLHFSESPEHIARTAPALATYESAQDPVTWVGDVYRAFLTIFGREPAVESHALWVRLLSEGATSFDGLLQSYMNAAEYTAAYGGTSDAEFVGRLFDNMLGRPAAQAGLDHWTGLMAGGLSRLEVISAFSGAAELVTRTAGALADWVRAQGPDDVLTALGQAAVLSGGTGADVFVFRAADSGDDALFSPPTGAAYVVTDLEPWDVISLEGFGYGSTAEAASYITALPQGAGGTGGGETGGGQQASLFADQGIEVTFLGVSPETVAASLFV